MQRNLATAGCPIKVDTKSFKDVHVPMVFIFMGVSVNIPACTLWVTHTFHTNVSVDVPALHSHFMVVPTTKHFTKAFQVLYNFFV